MHTATIPLSANLPQTKQLMRDADMAQAMREIGFCVTPLVDEAAVTQLKALYEENFKPRPETGLYASHNANPFEFNKRIDKSIYEIVAPCLNKVFEGYRYFVGHYMVKQPQTQAEFALHQDWNIVDESHYTSYQVWIPLDIACRQNGGMFVTPGSHRFFGNHRSGSYDIPRIATDDLIHSLISEVTVAPGNALVYHNSLFHGSYPNLTQQERLSVIVNVYQHDAPIYYFHHNGEADTTELYPLSSDILLNTLPQLEKGQLPSYFSAVDTLPANKVDNARITSQMMQERFYDTFGPQAVAGECKQLHILNDPKLEQEINQYGYTVVDFLNDAEVKEMMDEYLNFFPNIDRTPGRFTTLEHSSYEKKTAVHQFLTTKLQAALQRLFHNYEVPVSQFYTKKAHTSGDIDLHGDTTLLLNSHFEPHYAIWCPLMEVDENNGTLTVIPFSHRVFNTIFTNTVDWPFDDHLDWIRQFEKPLHLKPGQAVLFDNNLIHNSTANTTETDRVCIAMRFTHQKSQYYSFFKPDRKKDLMEVYAHPHDYYMNQEWKGDQDRPDNGKFVGTMSLPTEHISKADLLTILTQNA